MKNNNEMSYWPTKLALLLIYLIFAILLNSVGTVILQSINFYQVSKSSASLLEGFKDIPIALVSFVAASYLPRLGYKNSMTLGLMIVSIACFLMPLIPSFLMTKMLFLCIGVAFALVKVSVYATIGVITNNPNSHASLLNGIEGFFMVGVLSGYWIFSAFVDVENPNSADWLQVYFWLSGACLLNIVFLRVTPFAEPVKSELTDVKKMNIISMLQLMYQPMVYVFIIAAFLYVLIEQSIGTWLPTFNNEILKLPIDISIQITSIFAACIAIGRLSASAILQRVNWYSLLMACLILMAILILLVMPLTAGIQEGHQIGWSELPIAAWIFPLIGLFMAPIYPAINSVILSALPRYQHASMTGLIVVFSALGGTFGSLLTGQIFANFNGQIAFYATLVPIAAIMLAVNRLNHLLQCRTVELASAD